MTSTMSEGMQWIEYDYAVVRLVPYAHLEAFMNIGVVMHSRTERYLEALFALDIARVESFAPAINIDLLDRYIAAYCRVCEGGPDGGAVGVLPASERFHWLTAPRSAVLQTSRVHPGRCRDLASELQRLVAGHCTVIS